MKKLNQLPLHVKIVIAVFFLILTTLWINNYFTETEIAQVEDSPLDSLDNKQLNDLVSVSGKIVEIYTTEHGIINFGLLDENGYIDVSLMPNTGMVVKKLKEGYEVKVIGLLSRYQDRLQVQPLSKNSIYIVDNSLENIGLPEVLLHELDGYIDERVLLLPFTVREIEPFISSTGKEHLRLELEQDNFQVSSIMFEGKWKAKDVESMSEIPVVQAVANISTFNNEVSIVLEEIYPVTESFSSNNTEYEKEKNSPKHRDTIALSEVHKYMDQEVRIGPVQFDNVREFNSNSGKMHLQFDVHRNGLRHSGIMFEGLWDDREEKFLKSSGSFYIDAEVSIFNEDVSIIVKNIEE